MTRAQASLRLDPNFEQFKRMVHDIRGVYFSGRVHAGNAEADTSMLIARRPFNSDAAFRHLYALSPAEIEEIGRSSWALVL